jgi:hypothetical protein
MSRQAADGKSAMKTQESKLGRTALRRKRGGSGWLWVALAVWGFHGGGLLTACGDVYEGGGSDSNTHWLEPCERDADCGDLVCQCGQCTQPCADDGACGSLPGASCAQSTACSDQSEPASCVAECSQDADCGVVREGLRCHEQQCVSIAGPGSGGSGGGGAPSNGGSGGSLAGNSSVAGNGGTDCVVDGKTYRNNEQTPSSDCNTCKCQAGGIVCTVMECPIGGASGEGGSGGSDAGAGGSTAGAGPTEPCAPMDVNQTGIDLPCLPGPPTYAWNGDYCAAFSACGCEGEDCDELYPTLAACDASYQACYESQGITGACEQDADCRLTYRGCCEPCADVVGLDGLAATTESEEPNWHVCQQTADCDQCAEPPYEPSQEAGVACRQNRCTVVSRCEGLDQDGSNGDEQQCRDRSMCKPLFGHRPGVEEDGYVGCAFDPESEVNAPSQCELADLCGISDTSGICIRFGMQCVNQKLPQGFRLASCEDPACLP